MKTNNNFKMEKPFRKILRSWYLNKRILTAPYKVVSYLLDVYYSPSNKGKAHRDISIRPSVEAIMANAGYSETTVCSALQWLEKGGNKKLIVRRLPGNNDKHQTTHTDLNPLFTAFWDEWKVFIKNRPSSKGVSKSRKPKRNDTQVRFKYPLSRSRKELGLTPKEIEITLVLVDESIKTRNFLVTIPHSKLQKLSGCCNKTTRRCLLKLEGKKLIKRNRNPGMVNTYDITPLRNKLIKLDRKLIANRFVLKNPDYARVKFNAVDIQSIFNVILDDKEPIIKELILNKRTFVYFLNTFQGLENAAKENPGEELWFVDTVYPQSGILENKLANYFGLTYKLTHKKLGENSLTSPKTRTYAKEIIYYNPQVYGYEGKRLMQQYPDISLYLPTIYKELDSENSNVLSSNKHAKLKGKEKHNYIGDEWLSNITVTTANPFKFCNWLINKTLDIANELEQQLDTGRKFFNKELEISLQDKVDRLIHIWKRDAGKRAVEMGINFYKYTGNTVSSYEALYDEVYEKSQTVPKIPSVTSPVAPGSTQNIEGESLC